jgi:phosphonate transport system permease protein
MSDLRAAIPARFVHLRPWHFMAYFLAVALFIWANEQVDLSARKLIDGVPALLRLATEMLPPDLSRIGPIASATVETLLMAVVGCAWGIVIGFVLAVFATRKHCGHPLLYWFSRGLVSFFRSVPDLVWAVFFVVAVGLGPFAGTLAIVVDTIGFCGRFFAEAMEEVDPGPQEALTAIGATRAGIILSAVVPAAMPSFVNTGLFSLEKAVRSSVVLGLVGAGGIGIELKVAMDMFEFGHATTIILLVFFMVIVVEQVSARIRAAYL